MRIRQIELDNYRRFSQYRCEFDESFTLLIGPNGSGKSSLIRAIAAGLGLALGSWAAPIDEDVRRVDSTDPGGTKWRTPVYPLKIESSIKLPNGDLLQVLCTRGATGANGGYKSYFGPVDGNPLGQRADLSGIVSDWLSSEPLEATPIFVRLSARSEVGGSSKPTTVQSPFETRQQVWQRASMDGLDISAVAQWFQYNELRALQEGTAPVAYRVAREAVLAAVHADDIRYVVRDNQLMLRHADQGWRPFDQLSDGQRRIAALFCELALRCASMNSHLAEACLNETPGIVTIDELDLHLHPNWQRAVIGDLLRVFPRLQFIAASHSPFLLQSAYEHGRVLDVSIGEFVDPTDCSIEDIAESVMGVDQPQRGQRFLELKRLSQKYYDMLDTPAGGPEQEADLKQRLDVALSAFANDPASAAWLEQRRAAKGR